MPDIAFIKIHPAIGIARLGNHLDAYFIGPERPFDFTPPVDGYKAEDRGVLKVKRQAARFRLYAYDAKGRVLGEITKKTAQIIWRVRLANKKAAWEVFEGPHRSPGQWRNRHFSLNRRRELMIDSGERTIDANSQEAVAFDTGSFVSFNPATADEVKVRDIYLGELRTDDAGRLLVLGGRGKSDSPSGTQIEGYANNDGWYDDISDGPIDAVVTVMHEGRSVTPPVTGAWVVCAPPDFAPPVLPIVSLYDMLYDRAVAQGVVAPPTTPTFAYDIFPPLEAALNTRSVYADPLVRKQFHQFAISAGMPKKLREAIMARIRVPKSLRKPKTRPGTAAGNMPRLRDGRDLYSLNGLQDQGFTVTPTQYLLLERWANGTIAKKGGDAPLPPSEITPEGLDRAALASCIGGAFFPGIEAGWFLESATALQMNGADFLRIDRAQLLFGDILAAGDLTKHMAVPWQADFYKCTKYEQNGGGTIPAWWPSARPNEVPQVSGADIPWAEPAIKDHNDMVERWWRLGFVVADANGFHESQRDQSALPEPVVS